MSLSKPEPNFASRQLARVLPLAGRRSRPSSWLLSLTMIVGALLFQALNSTAASVIFFFLLIGAHAVWFLGERPGIIVAIGAVIAASVVSHFVRDAHIGLPVEIWNAFARMLSVGLLAFVMAGLRRTLELERWRASTDQLTGVLNRGAFEEELNHAIGLAESRGEALVLAYMDLDGFKAVNDRYGHSAGNRVLIAFASAASAAMRAPDLFARIGGDEFACLLTVPSCVEGDRAAELLHHRLSTILGTTGFAVTCSMGALVMDARQMANEAAILEQADRLMYTAKDTGKNALHIGRGETLSAILRQAFPPARDEHDETVVELIGSRVRRRA